MRHKLGDKVFVNGLRPGYVCGYGVIILEGNLPIEQVLVNLDPVNIGNGIIVGPHEYISIVTVHPDNLTLVRDPII